jgi:hypothetical protein
MKILNDMAQQSEAWFKWREGKITSSVAKTLVGYKDLLKADLLPEAANYVSDEAELKKLKVDELKAVIAENDPEFDFRKMAYKQNEDFEYRMLAHDLSDGTAPDEDPRDRGHRLEPEARDLFAEKEGKKVEEVGGLERTDEPRIAMSPDGVIFTDTLAIHEAVEIKALAGWKHVKIWQTDKVLPEFKEQCLQYFVVNDDLQQLHFISYCPEIKKHPLHVIVIERTEYERDIATMLEAQRTFLKAHDERLNKIYYGS